MDLMTVISPLKASLDLAKAALAARDEALIRAALDDLTQKATEALNSALQATEKAALLQAALSVAQREKSEIEDKLKDRAMYQLHEVRPGAFVYAPKPDLDGSQTPQHYVCQPCYDKGVKSIYRTSVDGHRLVCPTEQSHGITLHAAPPVKTKPGQKSWVRNW